MQVTPPPPSRNTNTNRVRYKFDQTDRKVFRSTLEVALSLDDIPELKSTQNIDKYADFIVTAVSTAVAKVIPTSESRHPDSQPVWEESPAYIHTYLHIYIFIQDTPCQHSRLVFQGVLSENLIQFPNAICLKPKISTKKIMKKTNKKL